MRTLQNILFVAIGGLVVTGAMVIDTDPKSGIAQMILAGVLFFGMSKAFKEE